MSGSDHGPTLAWNPPGLNTVWAGRLLDFSPSGLSRYRRARWLTLLALFKFSRSAIQSWRTVVRSLIVRTIATLRQSPLAVRRGWPSASREPNGSGFPSGPTQDHLGVGLELRQGAGLGEGFGEKLAVGVVEDDGLTANATPRSAVGEMRSVAA
jgi:hypothetical protein